MSKKKQAGAPAELADLDGPSADVYEALRVKIAESNTVAELMAAVDDDFKADVARLPEVAARALRDYFSLRREEIKHVVKMEQIAGKVVIVTDPPDFPPPTKTKSDGTLSIWCVIRGTIEATGEAFQCRSSAVRIVRHFENSKVDSYPQRLTFYQESHASMVARNAAQGSSPMWLVKKEAAPRERTDGVPF